MAKLKPFIYKRATKAQRHKNINKRHKQMNYVLLHVVFYTVMFLIFIVIASYFVLNGLSQPQNVC